MRVRSVTILTILLGASVVLLGQSRQNWQHCKSADLDQKIAGCSALIQSGKEKSVKLAEAFNDRGLAYLHRNDYDHALSDFEKAVHLDPYSAKVIYNLGLTYAQKANYDNALGDFDESLRLNPNSSGFG